MSKELKHADVIIHMAKHGFESVEGQPSPDCFYEDANDHQNPILNPCWKWRIKPATITYTVTVPDNIKPKKRLIDWSKMPRGTMTNRGEFMRMFNETKAMTWVIGSGLNTPLISDLRLVEQIQFTCWCGGECPVPEEAV